MNEENINKKSTVQDENPCKPPYKRGHGGYCGCDCKCLAPECWDRVKVFYECTDPGCPTPGIGVDGTLVNTCGHDQKLCEYNDLQFCQDINMPCFGYDCWESGCEKVPYIPGMYSSMIDCTNYCESSIKYKYLVPHNIIIDGKKCLGGICPEQPDWVCCLDGVTCAPSYADCGCGNCQGVVGCTNPNSPNYNPAAQCDDGSCVTCCNSGRCGGDSRLLGLSAVLPEENIYAKDLLIEFNKKEIDYLIVGSVARANNYRDIDILYKDSDENLNKIIQILNKYEILTLDINHTIIPCSDVEIDLFSIIPYQNLKYNKFKETTNINVLGVSCPAITVKDAKLLIKPSDVPLPMPFIGDGGPLGGGGYCGSNCGLPGGSGECHPTFNQTHFVPPERSCTGVGFTYESCYTCSGNQPPKTLKCYYCEDSSGCIERVIQYSESDFPEISGAPDCSFYITDRLLYNSSEECMLSCYGSPNYNICYYCARLGTEGVCNPIFVPSEQCGFFNYYDNLDICESACSSINPTTSPEPTTTPNPTTEPETPCEIEITTEGCCLEYAEETIYAVGDGTITAIIKNPEKCCSEGSPSVKVNGSDNSYLASDGESIEIELEVDPCSCTEASKEPSGPSEAGCPKQETLKPLVVLDKKTNKIKILINKKNIKLI